MQGHIHRNAKTAIMFTIALSFLIFTGSSFMLIGNMLSSQIQAFAGANFMINAIFDEGNYLPETDITAFLQQNSKIVDSWSYESAMMQTVLNDLSSSYDDEFNMAISGASGFGKIEAMFMTVDENFLDTAFQQFYVPAEVQDIQLPTLSTGEKDSIAALYSDEGLTEFNDRDVYNIYSNEGIYVEPDEKYLHTKYVKLVIPEGLRSPLGVDTKSPGRLCINTQKFNDYCDQILRVSFRALVSKMPGFLFSSYQQVQFFAQVLMSKEQYSDILKHYSSKETRTF
jgi:hypothetical protein